MENLDIKKIVINEDGEGEIGGKTIRQLEAEIMNSAEFKEKVMKDKKFDRMIRKSIIKGIIDKLLLPIRLFLKNNYEVLIGIIISGLFILLYFYFRTNDPNIDVGLIGGIIGGLGAMFSILLTINYTKKINEEALECNVLPYIIVKKIKPVLLENSIALRYKQSDNKEIFKGWKGVWKEFDYNLISEDKQKLKRNGVAYIKFENIGSGPAKNIKFKIENFGNIFLEKDYLKVGEDICFILDFNNPDKDYETDITLEYESIRNCKHKQIYHASISWHLDRTNFTLFC